MTEEEWLTSTNQFALLGHAHAQGWERKVRLYSCACCRFANRIHQNDWITKAVERAELYADRKLAASTMERWQREANKRWRGSGQGLQPLPPIAGVYLAVHDACEMTEDGHYYWSWKRLSSRPESSGQQTEAAVQALLLPLLRDIFGNPFRPVTFDPAWRTSDVMLLAKGIYADKAFDRMPILADALQDAGCDAAELLDHCCGPGPHVRGCWAVDLVLGKS